MRTKRLDRAGKRGHCASKTLRPDARGIYFIEDCLLHLGVKWVGIMLVHRTQQCALGKIGCFVARAAKTNADHDRRTGI